MTRAPQTWRDWWFLRRPWASWLVTPGLSLPSGAERRATLRASFWRVCVEVSFPWRRKP